MKISAQIDRRELERSLRRYSKRFGDTTAQAVVRWSVQTCRELAFETQPHGSAGVRKKQEEAIRADILRVCLVCTKITQRGRGFLCTNSTGDFRVPASAVIEDAGEVVAWMDDHRNKGKRTRELPLQERKVITTKTYKAALRLVMLKAGMAKGGWLGAGRQIAAAQSGTDRLTIGKNFLSYAQKHADKGSAQRPRAGFTPRSTLRNAAQHSGIPYVLSKGAVRKAVDWGLQKTVKWYQKAVRAMERKKQ